MIRKLHDDEGQTSIFIIGTVVIVLLFSLTIAAITTVTLQHRKLLSLADSAAQRAATAFTIADPEQLSLTLSQSTAQQQVTQHLAEIAAQEHFTNLQVETVQVVDETTVRVRLAATAHPPVVNWVLPSGVPVVAEGTARTQLEQ